MKCPTCGEGEVEITSEATLMGTDIVGYAHDILREEAFRYTVKIGDIAGPSRVPHIVEARNATALRLSEELDMTLESIARILGGRDHSAVVYMLRRARGESPAEAKKKRVA